MGCILGEVLAIAVGEFRLNVERITHTAGIRKRLDAFRHAAYRHVCSQQLQQFIVDGAA